MAETQHDADIINADRRKQATLMQEHLEKMGVQIQIAHYTGDSSYPTEYTLRYNFVSAIGPTLDLALLEFVQKLLVLVPDETTLEEDDIEHRHAVQREQHEADKNYFSPQGLHEDETFAED